MSKTYLELDSLRLRAVEPDDADLMWEADNDASQWGDVGIEAPFSRENMRTYALTYDADPFRAGQLRLILEFDGVAAGIIDLYDISPSRHTSWVGIYILPRYRGRNFGRVALNLLSDYACDILNLRVLAAKISANNPHSANTFSAAGFQKCGSIPNWLLVANKPVDLHIYQLQLSNA